MDICSFVNSPDIADYLRKVDYQFNSLETSWLIYQCKHITLEEKYAAWEELIATMPDCPVPDRPNCEPRDSLHATLRQYMALLKKSYQDFMEENPKAIYRYSFYCADDWTWCEEFDTIYISLDKVWKEIDDDMDLDIRRICIKKEILGDEDNVIQLEFNGRKELLDVVPNAQTEEERDLMYSFFDGFWFQFPVPFVKGDIVEELREDLPPIRGGENGPFVLRGCTGWEGAPLEFCKNSGDNSDMNGWGHFQNEDGSIYDEVMFNYMDLVYYKVPFTGTRRFLKALSNFEKGEIDVDLLLCAYKKVLLDEFADDVMLHSWYTQEGLEKAGLKET